MGTKRQRDHRAMDNRTVDHGIMGQWGNGTLGQWNWESRPRGQCKMGQCAVGNWEKEQWDNGILNNLTVAGQCHNRQWDNVTVGQWDNRPGDNRPMSNETMDIGTMDILASVKKQTYFLALTLGTVDMLAEGINWAVAVTQAFCENERRQFFILHR